MFSVFSYLVAFLFMISSTFADQIFLDREGREIRIAPVKSIDEIDLARGKEILVSAFMKGYEDVPLVLLDPEFQSIGDVRRFYERYFDSELEHFKHGELIWVQAFEGEKLLGWATFEIETNDSAYMDLLAVDPAEQRRGIGQHLTFSIRSPDLFPNIQTISLFIRKVNANGRKFYEGMGFSDFQSDRKDNFVDLSLLTGMKWFYNTK